MTMTSRFLGPLLFVALLIFAPAALATDGVVLINQNTSVNGLPGCPHAGFPIMICQSGSYRLSGHLSVPNADTNGIDITADNVTLDLNGFTLSGPVTCTPFSIPLHCTATGKGIGISVVTASSKNITVQNGTVRGMGSSGIQFSTTVGGLVEDMHVESSGGSMGAGIVMDIGTVTRCTVTANAGSGIVASSDSTISFNSVTSNGAIGVGGGGLVSNNDISENGQDGISGAELVLHNSIHANRGFGINGASGFLGNLILSNNAGTFTRATSMGQNLCDGVAC
jgi:hypothetical protein